jgi:hypothetical protein
MLTVGKARHRVVSKRILAALFGIENQMGRIASVQLALDAFRNRNGAADIERLLGVEAGKCGRGVNQ